MLSMFEVWFTRRVSQNNLELVGSKQNHSTHGRWLMARRNYYVDSRDPTDSCMALSAPIGTLRRALDNRNVDLLFPIIFFPFCLKLLIFLILLVYEWTPLKRARNLVASPTASHNISNKSPPPCLKTPTQPPNNHPPWQRATLSPAIASTHCQEPLQPTCQ